MIESARRASSAGAEGAGTCCTAARDRWPERPGAHALRLLGIQRSSHGFL